MRGTFDVQRADAIDSLRKLGDGVACQWCRCCQLVGCGADIIHLLILKSAELYGTVLINLLYMTGRARLLGEWLPGLDGAAVDGALFGLGAGLFMIVMRGIAYLCGSTERVPTAMLRCSSIRTKSFVYLLMKKRRLQRLPRLTDMVRLAAQRGGVLARKGDGEAGAKTIARTELWGLAQYAQAVHSHAATRHSARLLGA